jgi:hypothetical protein
MNSEHPQCCRITQMVLLVSLLMMGAGVGSLLWNDVRQKNLEVSLGKKFVADFQANDEGKIKWFVTSLQDFARSNPDFKPILAKYNLLAAATAASRSPGVLPGPLPKK